MNPQERMYLIIFGYILYNFEDIFTCICTIQPQMRIITSAFIFAAPAGSACLRLRVVWRCDEQCRGVERRWERTQTLTHTHSRTHTHAHSPSSSDPHTHATHTRRKKTHEGQRRLFLSDIWASLSVRGRRQKKFPAGEEEERKRRGVSTRRAALWRFWFWFWTLFFCFLILYVCVGITRRGSSGGIPSLRALLLHRQAASRRCVDKQSTIKGTEKKKSWTRADQRGPETHQVGSDLILHVLLNIWS